MASPKLALLEAKQRIAAAHRRMRTKTLESALVRKGTGAVTAATLGTMNRLGVPVTIGGFPWKIALIAIAQLGEGLSRGAIQAAMAGVADATSAIYIERSISTKTLIAGEGDEDGGEV